MNLAYRASFGSRLGYGITWTVLLAGFSGAALAPTVALAQTAALAQTSESGYNPGTPPVMDQPSTPFDNLVTAEQNVLNARMKYLQAQEQYALATRQLTKIRKTVRDTHRSSSEMLAAVETVRKAKDDFERAREPVLQEVCRLPAYQSLDARRVVLERQLADDVTLAGELRDAVAAQLLEIKNEIRKLEQAAIEFDIGAKAAQDALRLAESQVRATSEQTQEALEQDPQLLQAKTYLVGTQQNLRDAYQELTTEYTKLRTANADYRRAAVTNAIIYRPDFWYGRFWWR